MMQHDWGSGPGEQYRLGRRLESSSTGEVFEVTHPLLPGPCAIKILRPDLASRPEALRAFEADVAAVTALRHPNILPVVDVGSLSEDQYVIITERLEGRLLAERLAEQGAIPLGPAVEIVKAAAAGLQAAHDLGIVHGELNPRNLFLARTAGYPQGLVKLLDFGVFRLRSVDAAASLPVDTLRYLSPEQAGGRGAEIDGSTDQFSLALVSYRMLCGADAFAGDSAVSLLYDIVHGKPALEVLREGGPEVEAVIRRALAKHRRDRFDSIVAFAQALGAAAGESTGVVLRATPPPTAIAVRQAPPEDADPLLTHPFFTQESEPPRRRRRRVIYRRPPRGRGRPLLLLTAVAVAWVAGWMAFGWRPPLAWRESALWHELGLPGAAAPAAAGEGEPSRPR